MPLTPGTYIAKGESCGTSDMTKRIIYWGGENGFNIADMQCKIRSLRITEDDHYILRQHCDLLKESGEKTITLRFTLPSRTTIRMGNITYRYCGKEVKF